MLPPNHMMKMFSADNLIPQKAGFDRPVHSSGAAAFSEAVATPSRPSRPKEAKGAPGEPADSFEEELRKNTVEPGKTASRKSGDSTPEESETATGIESDEVAETPVEPTPLPVIAALYPVVVPEEMLIGTVEPSTDEENPISSLDGDAELAGIASAVDSAASLQATQVTTVAAPAPISAAPPITEAPKPSSIPEAPTVTATAANADAPAQMASIMPTVEDLAPAATQEAPSITVTIGEKDAVATDEPTEAIPIIHFKEPTVKTESQPVARELRPTEAGEKPAAPSAKVSPPIQIDGKNQPSVDGTKTALKPVTDASYFKLTDFPKLDILPEVAVRRAFEVSNGNQGLLARAEAGIKSAIESAMSKNPTGGLKNNLDEGAPMADRLAPQTASSGRPEEVRTLSLTRPVDLVKLVDQVQRVIESRTPPPPRQLMIRLDPPSLGHVEIQLTRNADGWNVNWTVNNQDVRDWLTVQLPSFQNQQKNPDAPITWHAPSLQNSPGDPQRDHPASDHQPEALGLTVDEGEEGELVGGSGAARSRGGYWA